MSYKQRCQLTHVNRIAIFALSLVGLWMDGTQPSDFIFSATIVLWLWLPQCTRLEARLLEKIQRSGQSH